MLLTGHLMPEIYNILLRMLYKGAKRCEDQSLLHAFTRQERLIQRVNVKQNVVLSGKML